MNTVERERRFHQAVDHVRQHGRLHPSDLQIPILTDPYCTQPLLGYEGGSYNPYTLGAACIVVPPSEGRGPNSKGLFNCNPDSIAKKKATSVPGFAAVRAPARPKTTDLPGLYYKFFQEQPPFNFLEQPPIDFLEQPPLAPDWAPLVPPENLDVDVLGGAAAANNRNRAPYLFHLMPLQPRGGPRVAAPEPTTAVDDVWTPADAPAVLAATSSDEITPDKPLEEVTGLIERLHLPGTATNAGGAAGAGEGGGGTLERALAFRTQGNQHFKAEDYLRALPLYSESIELLEGAGEDAAMATMLCNRSVAHLKSSRPAAALTDAERARALGGGKAHFRLAEALSILGLTEEAITSYEAALANAQEGDMRSLRGKIEGLQRGRVVVQATPQDFALKLRRAAAGTTLMLKRGRYMVPFQIRNEVKIVGEVGGEVVLDCTDDPPGGSTLDVRCAGRVVLQSLDVRCSAGAGPAHALYVTSGQVHVPIRFDLRPPEREGENFVELVSLERN